MTAAVIRGRPWRLPFARDLGMPARTRSETGQAPIEGSMPETRHMPLDRSIDAPCGALQERGQVQEEPTLADVLSLKAAATRMPGGGTLQRSPGEGEQASGQASLNVPDCSVL